MRSETIGPLRVLRAGQSDRPTIVLFHGYGAPADDLYSLHQLAPHDFNWIFPEGPIKLSMLPWFSGRAWFPLDLDTLYVQVSKGNFDGFENSFGQELENIKQQLQSFFKALNVPPSQLILGGFSQGAILATELAMISPKPIAGLVLLSTTLIHESRWKQQAPLHTGMRFFQSHGCDDQLLPFTRAQALNTLLIQSGWKGDLFAFEGGHELPNDALDELKKFLKTYPATL